MSREIKYKAIESYGDHTTKFEIQGVEGMKVREFISYIINNRPEDSGIFFIDGVKFPYDNKRRLLSISTDQAPCHLTIASVTAHGAYWQVDYEISTKNTTKPIMSRETSFKEGAWISGYQYSNPSTLQSDIEEAESMIKWFRDSLLVLAASNPKDITPEGEDPAEHIKLEFRQLWEELEEAFWDLHKRQFIQFNEEYIDKEE